MPITGSKVLVIDPAACKFSHDETAILSYLDKNRLEPCGILLTHGHFDHITGTRILKDRFPNCKIAVHKKDAPMCGSQARAVQGAVFDSMGLSYLSESIENLPDADILISGGETLDKVFAAERMESNSFAGTYAGFRMYLQCGGKNSYFRRHGILSFLGTHGPSRRK